MKLYTVTTSDGLECGPFMGRDTAEKCVLALASRGIISTIALEDAS